MMGIVLQEASTTFSREKFGKLEAQSSTFLFPKACHQRTRSNSTSKWLSILSSGSGVADCRGGSNVGHGGGPVSAGPAGHNQRCFAWPSARLQQDLRQDQRQGFTPAVSCDILDLSKATVSPRPVTSPVIGWGWGWKVSGSSAGPGRRLQESIQELEAPQIQCRRQSVSAWAAVSSCDWTRLWHAHAFT